MRILSRKPIPEGLLELVSYDPETGVITRKRTGEPTGRVHGHSGYVILNYGKGGKNDHYAAHRVAWKAYYGEEPPEYIDHINGDPTDNRISNLRVSTNRENGQNLKKHREGLVPGVEYERSGKWSTSINIGRKRVHLGTFTSKEAAITAYSEASSVMEAILGKHRDAAINECMAAADALREENGVREYQK